MSIKTDRLTDLFPDAFAAKDAESVLYKLLDAIGAEFLAADDTIKQLLQSHWVNYASGAALDGLGAIYGISRRRLRNGQLESDDRFRVRLKSIVQLFTGGGTVAAVKGAVRSALGLPFRMEDLKLPAGLEAMRADIDALIQLREFPLQGQQVIGDRPTTVNDASELILQIEHTGNPIYPEIQWTFTRGGGRRLVLERSNPRAGIQSRDRLLIPPGKTLSLSANEATGKLVALLDGVEISDAFSSLDNADPILPQVLAQPGGQAGEWKFRAQSGLFDMGSFDGDTFDQPEFRVDFRWGKRELLTFDIDVPYFLDRAINDLAARYGFTDSVFVFEGLPPDRIQEVVNQTKAAGVRGNVHFSLNFQEKHDQTEALTQLGSHTLQEDANAADTMTLGSFERTSETQEMGENFAIGGEFDFSTFDSSFGFM
jgi:hypothetical protein